MIRKQFESLDRYREIMESIPDIVCLTDEKNIIIDCNERLLIQLGAKRENIIGKSGLDFLTKQSQEKVLRHSSEIKVKGKIENLEVDSIKQNGTVFKALVTVSQIRDENGIVQGMISIIKDITDLYQTKIELKTQREKNLVNIGILSSRLAHDIRNPLSIIKMTLENMETTYGADDIGQKRFKKIHRAIFRISHQIDDVLDFIKVKPLELSKTKMLDVIANALDSLYIPNNLTLKLPKNDIELICDPKKLSIVFINLILNGVQSIDDKGVIEIRLKENTDGILIEIKDSGAGISKENLDEIFEPLFTTKQSGTGLGLASVKSIIEAHDGTISVTSPPTIFTITIPKVHE